ncbi:hypothetical protein MHO82_18405 [Vibrio sp. Of7-15]|uniref:hypothetical protein n=1 Tax=Vibrio sp. Of7-15 TaxID=2724879 RepID=UPI001EF24E73|nr:hypothetical protein [Vibrio sp. Of7-15]MCG7498845.1 hypothetical protein [Vibrio sp. Of7-15]
MALLCYKLLSSDSCSQWKYSDYIPTLERYFILSNLLNEFVLEECTESISYMLVAEIEKLSNNHEAQFKEFVFNRFTVYFDFNKNEVVLEDDLDPEESGVFNLSLNSFLEAIKK